MFIEHVFFTEIEKSANMKYIASKGELYCEDKRKDRRLDINKKWKAKLYGSEGVT